MARNGRIEESLRALGDERAEERAIVRVYILGPAALTISSQALSVFLAVWRRGGGPRYNKLIKWGYFIAYTEEILAENVARIYIKEVFIKYRVLSKIILDRDLRFIAVF